MRKFLLSAGIIALSGIYMVYHYVAGAPASAPLAVSDTAAQNTPAPATPAPARAVATQTQTQGSSPKPTPKPTPTPTPAPKPKGQYVDGAYTGGAADAYYGTIQVQATISGGRLVDVTFLQYPNDRSTSRYINSQAMPLLTQEAIAAQSANVSGVSGATDSSQAFVESLGSALAQAKS